MRILRRVLFYCLAAALACAPVFATTTTHRKAAPTKTTHKLSARSKRRAHKIHGQEAIAPERVTQIQQALIREHYMTGEADGQWNSTTQAAMQKFQADHGWQTRLMPDSRALKSLGLGPDYSTAINAQAAGTAGTTAGTAIPAAQAAGFAAASGVNR